MSSETATAGEENILEDLLHHEDDEHLFEVSVGGTGQDEDGDAATSSSESSHSSSSSTGKDEHSDISDNGDADTGSGCVRARRLSSDNKPKSKPAPASKQSSRNGGASSGQSRASSAKGPAKAKADTALSGYNSLQSSKSPNSAGTSVACDGSGSLVAVRPKKKGKSYDYATKLNYLFRDARFFLIKSNNAENVALAKSRGIWSTLPPNEARLNKAFNEARNVLLVFSVKESGRFAGLARLSTPSSKATTPVPWVLPPGISARALENVFKIDWISKKSLSFQLVQHLYNPWNSNKPVKIGRDGQEIEPRVAEELCRLFAVDETVDMTPILRKSKDSARRQRTKSEDERKQAVPTSKPLSGPPLSTLFGPPASMDRPRKRRYQEQEYFLPPPKVSRGRQHHLTMPPGGSPVSRYATAGMTSHRSPGQGIRRSYEEYLRSSYPPSPAAAGFAPRGYDSRHLPYPDHHHHHHHHHHHQQQQQQHHHHHHHQQHQHRSGDRRNYYRPDNDFLRRTGDRPRGSDDNRYRERR